MSVDRNRMLWGGVGLLVAGMLLAAAFRFFGSDGSREFVDDGSPYVIRSVPSKAEVFINNERVGQTPYKYDEFDPGILRIRVEQEGLAPVETVMIVRPDDPLPAFPSFVFTVPVALISDPPGAQAVVNGVPLRPYELASLSIRATDTLTLGFEMGGDTMPTVRFNPVEGILSEVDTTSWQWTAATFEHPAQLIGIFARTLRVNSEPSGADIFLDGRPGKIGRTNGRVSVPYGEHTLTLRLPPFEDAQVSVFVGRGQNEPVNVLFRKNVWLSAVDRDNPHREISARVAWVRQGERYLINPDDHVQTPTTVTMGGRPSEILFTMTGFRDTTVMLAAAATELVVEMRPAALVVHREPIENADEESYGWVRFLVIGDTRRPVEGAEVFGVEKDNGRVVRYGPTDADGVITTRVPLGDYEWWAAKTGYTGKPNGERVKRSRRTKEIKLRIRSS